MPESDVSDGNQTTTDSNSVSSAVAAREAFIGWQCRIRQHAMRNDGGRPSQGMSPRVLGMDGSVLMERMVTLIVPRQPFESTAFFKHQVRRSNDPGEILEKGLSYLQSAHFQVATGFCDELTALFPAESRTAAMMLEAPGCKLEFSQFNQEFRMNCSLRALANESDLYQATLWHNRMFNRELPDGVVVLGIQPDWDVAEVTVPV